MLKRLLGFRELALVVVLFFEILLFAIVQIHYDLEAGRIASWREALTWDYARENPYLSPTYLLGSFAGAAILAVACIGSCIVIIGGGIDLSVGSVIALSSVATAWVLREGLGVAGMSPWAATPLAVAAGMAIGSLCGAISGSLVTLVRLQPFVATLAMMSIARGVPLVLTEGRPVIVPRDSFFVARLGGKIALGPGDGAAVEMPVVILVLIAAALVFAFFMLKTKWGRQIFAIGGNEEAARFCGVRVNRIKMAMYVLAGLMAGLGGVLFAALHGIGQSSAAFGWELDAIAAVVVGGTLLTGGVGYVVGTLVGVLIFGIIQTGINFESLNSWWTRVAIGLLLFVFVLLQKLLARTGPREAP